MNVKTKRNLTYVTIALFNLSTGIGYAIVFPTIWNYIHERYGGTGPMLGLIISAYSISSFFSNPLLGLWADRTQNTKLILAIAVVMEIAGSLMYFFGISTWFLVASRLIAGFGGGGGAAIFADITRTTSESERTPVLAVVVSFRQLGLVLGPAFNLFLSESNFRIGIFPVDKFTSPGLFMAVLWILVELAVFGMYYNLTVLKDDEHLEQLFPGYHTESSNPQDAVQPSDFESSSSLDTGWNSLYEPNFPSDKSERVAVYPPNTSYHNVPSELLNEFKDNSEVHRENISTITCKNIPVAYENHLLYTHLNHRDRISDVDHRPSVTDSMIETAERFIQSSETGGNRETITSTSHWKTRSWESSPGSSSVIAQPSAPSTSVSSSLPAIAVEDTSSNDNFISSGAGYFRDEVVVLLGLAFISSFSQTVLETVVTPLAQKYYHFKELENSFIYLFAGIEVILVFVGIRICSRKMSDRVLLLFGITMMCLAMGLPLLFVPSAESGETATLPYFIITVIIDLIGIAIIVVCSASLLSKIISENGQAFSQGLRRSMVSLGCILGPLWGGAYLNRMYLLFAVPLAVSLLIGVLFICSFKRLK